MPRPKRTLQEADKNAYVVPATRSKRTRAKAAAEDKENDVTAQMQPLKKFKPVKAITEIKRKLKLAEKARVYSASAIRPISEADTERLFNCLDSTSDNDMVKANKSYQKQEEVQSHTAKLQQFLSANRGSLVQVENITAKFQKDYKLNTWKEIVDAAWALFGLDSALGKEFLATYLPSWIANQGYMVTMKRKADKDDGGKNNGFFFTPEALGAIQEAKKSYKEDSKKILGSASEVFDAAMVTAGQHFPREHVANYLAKVLMDQPKRKNPLRNLQYAATGGNWILDELNEKLLPKIDPGKDEDQSGFFNPPPDVNVAPALEYLTVPRPRFDYERQYDQVDFDEQIDMDAMLSLARKYSEKPIADFPNYKWIISKPALDVWDDLREQDLKRDPDNMNMYVYNDFYGYGQQEVIENALTMFHNEFKKPTNRDVVKMWTVMEGLGFFLTYGQFQPCHMIDDSERVYDTYHVIGYALLVALNHLERGDLLKPNSPLMNIPLVLGLFFHWLDCGSDYVGCSNYEGSDAWPDMVALYVRKHKIDIEGLGVYNIKDITMKEPYGDPVAAYGLSNEQERWVLREKYRADKFRFKELWKNFVEGHGEPMSIFKRYAGVGGDTFDITKFTPAERKKFSFDHEDPLEDVEL